MHYSGSPRTDFEIQAQDIAKGKDLRRRSDIFEYLPTRVICLDLAKQVAPKDQIAYGTQMLISGTKNFDESARPDYFLHWVDTLKLESALIGVETLPLDQFQKFRSEHTWDVHPLSQDGLAQRVWTQSLSERQEIFRNTLLRFLKDHAGSSTLAIFLANHPQHQQEANRMKTLISRTEINSVEYLPRQDLEFGLFLLTMMKTDPKRKSPETENKIKRKTRNLL